MPAATLGTLGISASGRTSTSSSYAPTYFSNAEWAFINAAVGRLVPVRRGGPGRGGAAYRNLWTVKWSCPLRDMAGNPIVQAGNPQSLVSVVLEGSQTPRTARTPAQFTMPGFSWRLSDTDVADVVNFIRTSWGNNASPAGVAGTRKSLQPRQAASGASD